MSQLRLAALLAAVCISTGCMRVTYVLNLKPNGSGTIATTIAMSEAVMQQAGAMAAAQGGSLLPDEAKLKAEAAALGAGVRFVSVTPYKANGFEGVSALYAFDDVRKLSSLNMERMMSGGIESPMEDPDDKPDPDADIKLSFTQEGGRSILVLDMPEVPKPDEISAEDKQKAAEAAKQAQNPQMEAMMKQMFQGMFMEVIVNIEGQILKTNAPFVEGTRIVLMRMDFNEMLKSEKGVGGLMSMGDKPDFEALMRGGVPGLKAAVVPEIRVEFR